MKYATGLFLSILFITSSVSAMVNSGIVSNPEQLPRHTAIGAPTVNDDITFNFTPGSLWVDTANDDLYFNVDSTDGAAVWIKTSEALAASVTLDLSDNSSNDSEDLDEIATTGDTNNIFTEPTPDKLLIDVSRNWPNSDTTDVASTGDTATAFFSSGVLEHERGGIEADISGYSGMVAIISGAASNIASIQAVEVVTATNIVTTDEVTITNLETWTSENIIVASENSDTDDDLSDNDMDSLQDVTTMTLTRGDLLYVDSSGIWNRLPLGSTGEIIKSDGTDVTWDTESGGGGGSVWSQVGDNAYYNNGQVSIGTTTNAASPLFVIETSAASGVVLIENTGTGDSLRVSDEAADSTAFVIENDGDVVFGRNITLGTTTYNSASRMLTLPEVSTEAAFEITVTDVSNVFTNNDGALNDDDLSNDDLDALQNVGPITEVRGDVLYVDSSGAWTKLGLGSNGQSLESDGTDLVWATDDTGGGGGLTWTKQNTDYVASSSDGVFMDTTVASRLITLPATGIVGIEVGIIDWKSTADTNEIAVDRNGNNIMGLAEDLHIQLENAAIILVFDGSNDWRIR